MTTATLFLKSRSLPLHLTTPFASFIHRLSSSAAPQAPLLNTQFAAVDYLTQSLGFPADVAVRASKKILHLKSPDKPDAVLQFLRQTGISEPSIRTAVSRDSSILCSGLEKNVRPNITKLQEIGLSGEDISGVVARAPSVFKSNFVPKVDYWLGVLGSVKNLLVVLQRCPTIVLSSLEKVIIPNFIILQEEVGLSVAQIARLVMLSPRLLMSGPESLKSIVKRAEELVVRRSSPMFLYALVVARSYNQCTLNAKLNNLKRLGFSQEEVAAIVGKHPFMLAQSEEMVGRKIKFMMEEVPCDKQLLIQNPSLFTYSLEKRLIPRSTVRKLLMSKGIPAGNFSFISFVCATEKKFLERFVLPYEPTIPGLHRAYTDACSAHLLQNSLASTTRTQISDSTDGDFLLPFGLPE